MQAGRIAEPVAQDAAPLRPLGCPHGRMAPLLFEEDTPIEQEASPAKSNIISTLENAEDTMSEEGEYLWDIYQEVLQTAQRAAGVMSTEEKARYDQAIAFLYTSSAEGLRRPSDALTAYSQYRDAHIKAQEEYKNRQFTAELSADPTVQAHWRDVDEPRLRQEVQRLEQEWLTQGFRAQVEQAQQVEQACN